MRAEGPHFKMLIVDDYQPFRRFVCAILRQRADFLLVEASDGLEAIETSEANQPDLIVFDVGLPKLDGLKAARRIRSFAPSLRILFISEESDPEIVREALNVGAQGYVHKLRVSTDLLTAVNAVLAGKRFVSDGLLDKRRNELTDANQAIRVRTTNGRERTLSKASASQATGPGNPNDSRYPWQQDVIDALRTVLPAKISAAERSVAARLREKRLDLEEQLALRDALRLLNQLVEETSPQQEAASEEYDDQQSA